MPLRYSSVNRILTVLLASGLSMVCNSQNYIRNSSFEKNFNTPRREGNSINRAVGWMAPKYSSDYYSKGGGFFHAGVPHNIFGHQKPHSGKSYAGICTRTHFLEYIETVLRDTLEAGKTYQIELYISRAELSFRTIKEFGVLFTNKKIWGLQSRGIAVEPQVKFTRKHGFRNKHKWTQLSGTYTAEGGETVFIFGHFNYTKKDDRRRLNAHYYIDDVTVTLLKDTAIIELQRENDTVAVSTTTTANNQIKNVVPILNKDMILEHVYFESNKSELLPSSFEELNTLVLYLNEHENTHITISGHTDNTGDEASNQILSELRAQAVANYLSENGIDFTRIKFKGLGSRLPRHDNATEEGRRKNRRVEFVISE